MNIVFFGTSPFAAQILSHLIHQKAHVVAVVTRPDRARGRSKKLMPSPVKEKSLEIAPSIPVFDPEKASTPEFEKELAPLKAELFVVVAYGEIIKQHLLDLPQKGCINIHASLLSKYRGAAPIQRAIMEGEKETGITIIEMVLKMDAGDMLAKAPVEITPNMNFEELDQVLNKAACNVLMKVLSQFENNTVKKTPQNPAEVSFAKKITPEDCLIDWTRSAEEVHNQIRALSPKPGAYTILDSAKRLKILKTFVNAAASGKPGEVISYSQNSIIIACGKSALQILELQPEGKKRMPADQFARGFPQLVISN